MWNRQNWERFKNLPRYKNLSPQEQARQYFLHQSNMMYEAALAPAAASSAAGAGGGSGTRRSPTYPESTGQDLVFWGQGVTNWEYFVMDINGTMTGALDTKLSISDWSYIDYYVITNKGFNILFQNSNNNSYAALFIQANGTLVDTLLISNYDDKQGVDGRIIYYTYPTTDGFGITYFDGDNIYTLKYSGATSLSFEWNWDGVTTENAILISVSYIDYVSWRVIKGKNDVEIHNISNTSVVVLQDYEIYYTGNWVYTSTYNNDTSRYESINFFNSDGVLVVTQDLTSLEITARDWYMYGTGKILISMYNSDNSSYYFYNFDGIKLTSTQHEYNPDYYNSLIVAQDFYPYYAGASSPAYDPESVVIYLGNGTNNSGLIDTTLTKLDIITKFDDHNFNTYNFTNGSTASIMLMGNDYGTRYERGSLYNFPTSNSIFNFVDNGDGKLSVLGIKADGSTFSINIDDVNISDLDNLSYQPFGQWRMIEYRLGSYPEVLQRYKIYDANGNFIANYDTHDTEYANFRPYYDLLYVRTWSEVGGAYGEFRVGTTSNTLNYNLHFIPPITYGGVQPTIYGFFAGLTGGSNEGFQSYDYSISISPTGSEFIQNSLTSNYGGTGSYNQLTGELDLHFGLSHSNGQPIYVAYLYQENFIFNNNTAKSGINYATFSSLPVFYYARAYDNDEYESYTTQLLAPNTLTSIGSYNTVNINILTSTTTSGNIVLPPADSNNIGVGTNYTAFFYQDPNNNNYWTINLYNLDGLVNSVCVNSSNYEDYFVSGDRYFISTVDNGVYTYNLITPTAHYSATSSQYNYLVNDAFWWDQY